LNYYERFLTKYLVYADKDEATMSINPIMLKGASDTRTSLPVKKYLAKFFAEIISSKANMYLRMTIQESLLKDFAMSDSSQVRLVFVHFLEHLVMNISKQYFSQVFLEAYLSFENDPVPSILSGFVRLVPQVRFKVDDARAIQRLDQSLTSIKAKA
jgi:cellobiose-specific phosphotransferase system component IIA